MSVCPHREGEAVISDVPAAVSCSVSMSLWLESVLSRSEESSGGGESTSTPALAVKEEEGTGVSLEFEFFMVLTLLWVVLVTAGILILLRYFCWSKEREEASLEERTGDLDADLSGHFIPVSQLSSPLRYVLDLGPRDLMRLIFKGRTRRDTFPVEMAPIPS